MCGIIGGFDRKRQPLSEADANAACRRIAHRGPDDQGIFQTDGMLIGNRRLSILDLSGGHQPMLSDDGNIAVVQNGEIYNYLELARGLDCRTSCDTEVILRLYEREGDEFVRHLNGMFAIAIIDRRQRRLLLYRDRLGKKPLYLHDDGRRLLFASEIKALFALGVKPVLNWQALDAYLTFNYVPVPTTIFAGVRHLAPGHMLQIDDTGVRQRAYWRPELVTEHRSESDWHDELLATLHDAVRIRLRSDVPLGAFLSGGLDSSLVVRSMSDQMEQPVRTFCIGVNHADFDDSAYAERVAELCGADHLCEVVEPELAASWPLSIYYNDQPHGDASFLPTYWVSRMARRHVKVVLTGDGGDELFAGYDHHRRFIRANPAAASPQMSAADFARAYVRANCIFDDAMKRELYTRSAQRWIGTQDAADWAVEQMDELRHLDPVNRMLGLDVKMLLPGNNLVKPDKMSMAVALETRSPFLDYRLVEFAFRIPGSLKLRDGETKSILKRAAERLLPKEIVHRPKQMFTVPVGEWFKTSLVPFVRGTLLSARARERGVFEPRRIAALIDEHQAGRVDHTRRLRALIAFELWHRIYIDQQFDRAPTLAELGIAESPPVSRQLSAA
jgi:asparagine synthase (glutamine-hydrolysing)